MSDTLRCRKVYRFRLEPRGSQDLELERTALVSFYLQLGLDRCRTYYKANGKSRARFQLPRALTELKSTQAWLYDFDLQRQQQALANLERVYADFFAGRAKFPKFKKKKSARQSFRIRRESKFGMAMPLSLRWARLNCARRKHRGYAASDGKIMNTVINEADEMVNEAATKPANSGKD